MGAPRGPGMSFSAPPLRVAVLGSGPAGLAAAKSCLEAGLEPVVFEQAEALGGLWRFRPDSSPGRPSVMRSTVINSSKELTAFSDFPPPAHFANYMHHSVLLEYLQMYARHFRVAEAIRFGHQVVRITPARDHQQSGRWDVTVKHLATGSVTCSPFDAVMVCTGHHAFPARPASLRGLQRFGGTVLHSHAVKDCLRFRDRRLLVLGAGNSAMDVATEASLFARKVYLSTRRGTWVLHRVAPNGLPMDTLIQRRYFQHLPLWLLNRMAERECQKLLNHELFGLKPRHRLFQQHPTINDALANRVLSGTLVIKGDVDEFTETGVRFGGDAEDTKVDDVVLATGYDIRFPFLDESLLRIEGNRLPLFRYVFPAHLEHPETLSFLGYIQPLGAINPIAEMQARWVVQVLLGNVRLPSKEEMISDMERTETSQRSRYVSSPRHTIQVDYMPYTRDLARRIGADPSLVTALLRRPALFWALLAGPQVPYMFRLQGPHSWQGAAEAVISTQRRIEAPIRTRRHSAVGDVGGGVSSPRPLNKLLGADRIVAHALEMAIVIVSVCVVVVPLLVNYLFG
ncbi:flavin-containing monooxygenase 5-like [Dermacentor variabilis]|uniref:flavin-containing monooxygenase 5-like n=1 Tax=Dermacentor variabilis TaxID=34621 RepID=UPI003F5BE060